MKLRKCRACGTYTMKEICPKCGSKTSDAHYKFVKFGEYKKDSLK